MSLMVSGARTTFWLSAGFAVSSLISAVCMIIIARLLGRIGYGLFSATLFIVTIVQAVEIFGMGVALIRFVARAKSRTERAKYVKATMFFELTFGICLSIILIVFSDFIANELMQKPELSILIKIASLMVIASGMQVVGVNYFIGIERAKIIAGFYVISSILRNCLAIGFLLLGYGVLGVVLGQSLGLFLVCFAIFIMAVVHVRPTGKIKDALKEMLIFAIPYAISNILLTLSNQIYNLLATRVLSQVELGIFSSAVNAFSVIFAVVNMVALGFLPSFSRVSRKEIQASFKKWVKFISYLAGFLFAIVFAIGKFLIPLFFGEPFARGGFYFMAFSLSLVSAMLGLQIIISILLGIGKTRYIMYMWIPSIAIGLMWAVIFLDTLQAYSIIIGYVITYILAAIFGLVLINHEFGVTIDIKAFVKILIMSIISELLGLKLAIFNNILLNTFISGIVSAGSFLFLTLLTRPLSFGEIKEFFYVIKHLPIVGGIIVVLAPKFYEAYLRALRVRQNKK